MIYQNYQQYPKNVTQFQTSWSNAQVALAHVKEAILDFDAEALVSINETEGVLQWTSAALSDAIVVSPWEVSDGVTLCFEHHTYDAACCNGLIAVLAKPEFAVEEAPPFQNVAQVLKAIITQGVWGNNIKVLPEAFKSAEDCPFLQTERLYEVLNLLPIFVHQRIHARGKALDAIAQEVGLGTVYRGNISDTAEFKYGHEYQFNYQGRKQFFREHLTLGGGANDCRCMSIHFLWDATAQCLVIGHIGRHCTNRRSHT
jgi:hypothetical protein